MISGSNSGEAILARDFAENHLYVRILVFTEVLSGRFYKSRRKLER